ECIAVKPFIEMVTQLCQIQNLTRAKYFLGENTSLGENLTLLLVKHYIYLNKLDNKPPNMTGLKKYVEAQEIISRSNAEKNNKLEAHDKAWKTAQKIFKQ
ncbi:unnamed protein product, partial [Owenia fusiformis]